MLILSSFYLFKCDFEISFEKEINEQLQQRFQITISYITTWENSAVLLAESSRILV